MMFDAMKTETGLAAMAVLWGVTNTLEDIFLSKTLFFIVLKFLGSTLIGTLITLGFCFLIVFALRKRHLLLPVTNWTLLVFSCLNVLLVTVQVGAVG